MRFRILLLLVEWVLMHVSAPMIIKLQAVAVNRLLTDFDQSGFIFKYGAASLFTVLYQRRLSTRFCMPRQGSIYIWHPLFMNFLPWPR